MCLIIPMSSSNVDVGRVSMFDILKAADDFAVLGLQPQFPLDADVLETAFRKRQQMTHPDQFVTGDTTQQRLATQASSRVNDAYDRLRRPLQNALALFSCQFGEDPFGVIKPDPDFLESLLQWREMADEAVTQKNIEQLADLRETLDHKINTYVKLLTEAFLSADRDTIAIYLIQWHYLDKLNDNLMALEDDILE